MLRKIWQWLKQLFQGLLGTGRQSSRLRGELDKQPPPTLTDTDYEFLLSQLLEGVANGWQSARVLKFFDQLGERGNRKQWVAWLQRFGERVTASPAPNNELAARLIQLNEQTQSVPSLREIGETAYDIGMRLLTREPSEPVWEYEGPDAEPTEPEEIPEAPPGVETITLDELMERLQQDENLVELISQQLGIETTDPQVIIEALLQQFNVASQPMVDDVEVLFNQGIEQYNAGDLEAAIASWDRVLEVKPDNYQAWHNRGVALEQLGRSEEANASFEKADEFRPA